MDRAPECACSADHDPAQRPASAQLVEGFHIGRTTELRQGGDRVDEHPTSLADRRVTLRASSTGVPPGRHIWLRSRCLSTNDGRSTEMCLFGGARPCRG